MTLFVILPFCLSLQIPFFAYVTEKPSDALHCVEVSKDRSDLVKCYHHITTALNMGKRYASDDIRKKTLAHIWAYVRRHGMAAADPAMLESAIYSLSGRLLQV